MPRWTREELRQLGIATWKPKSPPPSALRDAIDELEALSARGELTAAEWEARFNRVYAAAAAIENEDERLAHLEPFWRLGALVGCLRE
jgi:hypothetical protein